MLPSLVWPPATSNLPLDSRVAVWLPRAVINGTAPDPAAFGTAIAVAAVALALAYVWFKQTEATMADSV